MMKITKNGRENREQLRGARVAVVGAARSGIAVSGLLAASGASVLLSDTKPAQALNLPLEDLKKQGIGIETGGHTEAVLETDMICISPGLPLDIPVLKEAARRNIPVTGELEAASWFCDAPLAAITGSNGKTTTTTLAGEILKRRFPETVVAGNIGKPFAELVRRSRPEAVALLEVSSFQLETIHSFHPETAVIMNLTANHLDRYPDFESYAAAKLNILKNMTPEDRLIYNRDDEYLSTAVRQAAVKKLVFSLNPHREPGAYWENGTIVIRLADGEQRIALEEYHLRGPHNRYNMMVAALLGVLYRVPADIIAEEITRFPGIEHRLEMVRQVRDITFINDSKATTVESLGYALQSFAEKIVLIAGGKDKGGDFSWLSPLIKEKVREAVLIGQAAPAMERAWQNLVPISRVQSLRDAVAYAYLQAKRGDVVLFSPACSSFDMFRDYEDRGRQYKKLVKDL